MVHRYLYHLTKHPVGTAQISDYINNFWQRFYNGSLWGFQIFKCGGSTCDLGNLILALKIVYYCCDLSDVAIFQVFNLIVTPDFSLTACQKLLTSMGFPIVKLGESEITDW